MSFAGRDFGAYDVLPTTHAAEALRLIMIHGRGFGDIVWELGLMTGLSLLLLAIGIVLFQRLRMQAD